MKQPFDVSKRVFYDESNGGFRTATINVVYTCPVKDIIEALPLRMHGMTEEQITEMCTIFEAEYVNRQAAKAGYLENAND